MRSEREPVCIRLQQLHMPVTHTREELNRCIAAKLGIPEDAMLSLSILKQSLDARKKREIAYVYDVAVNAACAERQVPTGHTMNRTCMSRRRAEGLLQNGL